MRKVFFGVFLFSIFFIFFNKSFLMSWYMCMEVLSDPRDTSTAKKDGPTVKVICTSPQPPRDQLEPHEDDPRLAPPQAFKTSIALGGFGAPQGAPRDGLGRLLLLADVGAILVGPLGAKSRSSLSRRLDSKSRSSSFGWWYRLRHQQLGILVFPTTRSTLGTQQLEFIVLFERIIQQVS